MDSLKVQIIARDFNRMFEDLAAIDTSVEFSAVVDTVAMRVAAGALRGTRAAKPENIRRSHDKAKYARLNGRLYNLSFNYHNEELWRQIANHRAARLQQKLASVGLAKQSWWHLGARIFSDTRHGFVPMLKAPAYVVSANFMGHRYPEDASTFAVGDAAHYTRTISNKSPLIEGARMESALVRAMAGETKYYERLCANRFYLTAASRAAKYPGIFTRPQPLAASVPAGM